MNINRHTFFDDMRGTVFGRTYVQSQVDGIDTILNEWEKLGLTDLRWLAYILATVKWETAHTMQPIAEYGKGVGHTYGLPDAVTGQTYYGRGYVQLTWRANYEKMGSLLNVDLVNHPEKALEPDIAIQILFEGMLRLNSGIGDFTNHSLEEFFPENGEGNWYNARLIINGSDHASDIADIALSIWHSLQEATKTTT